MLSYVYVIRQIDNLPGRSRIPVSLKFVCDMIKICGKHNVREHFQGQAWQVKVSNMTS